MQFGPILHLDLEALGIRQLLGAATAKKGKRLAVLPLARLFKSIDLFIQQHINLDVLYTQYCHAVLQMIPLVQPEN